MVTKPLGMQLLLLSVVVFLASAQPVPPECPDYGSYSNRRHAPFSEGVFQLSYQRPEPRCRTFNLSKVEETIINMKEVIKDPDLSRLFENCFPNTLDTTITWKGVANGSSGVEGEELTFITTGDFNAMWLRDSANQLQSYKSLLRPNTSSDSLASLFRGAINMHSRYILSSPYCNAFGPPAEASLTEPYNPFAGLGSDYVVPTPDPTLVFECKYELDSLAAFLQLSADYHSRTGDSGFFRRSAAWAKAVAAALNATDALRGGLLDADGRVAAPVYLFQRFTATATETMMNGGAGSPVRPDTGMVRSAFRPSDDACIYQLLVPANMMFSKCLEACVPIMKGLDEGLARRMAEAAMRVRKGVEKFGKVNHHVFGEIYAYEVDGFGSHNVMDDANIPSLLSAPLSGYLDRDDPIYQNTREFVLSKENPYFAYGSVINSTSGPHVELGMAWPMSLIVRILTSDDDNEIVDSLKQILSSTDGYGLIHEAVDTNNAVFWTRQWFSWANGLFGQMMLDLRDRKPHLLALSYQ